MGLLGRIVRRVRPQLSPDEGLLASVLGRELDGRRRVAIIATDRRLLLAALRPEPPIELRYRSVSASCEARAGGASITLTTPDATHGIERIGDVTAARLLVDLINQRVDSPQRPAPPQRVRLIS